MNQNPIIICNFTNIYTAQPYMNSLIQSKNASYIDCSQISGTDCYCDDEACELINEKLNHEGYSHANGIHFFDNGNYHYMSKIWTDRIQEPFSLIVFDHHPDMQPPRFGNILSCGGWVQETIEHNSNLQSTIIIGVDDNLANQVNQKNATIIKESELSSFQLEKLPPIHQNIYLSIDKDVLSVQDAATNWDQGSLTLCQLKKIIADLCKNHKVIGVDICGERATDFSGDEYHSLQDADYLNNKLNQMLIEFLTKVLHPSTFQIG